VCREPQRRDARLSNSLSRVGKDLYGGEVTTQNDSSHGQPDWAFMPLLDLNTPAKMFIAASH
jgi:hypothetical protein